MSEEIVIIDLKKSKKDFKNTEEKFELLDEKLKPFLKWFGRKSFKTLVVFQRILGIIFLKFILEILVGSFFFLVQLFIFIF